MVHPGRWVIRRGIHRYKLFQSFSLQDGRNPAPDGVREVAPLVRSGHHGVGHRALGFEAASADSADVQIAEAPIRRDGPVDHAVQWGAAASLHRLVHRTGHAGLSPRFIDGEGHDLTSAHEPVERGTAEGEDLGDRGGSGQVLHGLPWVVRPFGHALPCPQL